MQRIPLSDDQSNRVARKTKKLSLDKLIETPELIAAE